MVPRGLVGVYSFSGWWSDCIRQWWYMLSLIPRTSWRAVGIPSHCPLFPPIHSSQRSIHCLLCSKRWGLGGRPRESSGHRRVSFWSGWGVAGCFPAEYALSFHNPNTLLLGLNAVNGSNKTFLPSTVISTSSPRHRFHPPATSALLRTVPECGCLPAPQSLRLRRTTVYFSF